MRADDIVQDVFIKLFENLNNINNKQSIQFWLFKTTRNEMMSFLRSTKTKKLISETTDIEEVEINSELSLESEIPSRCGDRRREGQWSHRSGAEARQGVLHRRFHLRER